ncbi:MAG: S-layer homology domain-containing protein, partial [Clostridia bacterium]|nr:S-layer homology domain-containing protein [Clostridia bacterium]
MKKNVLKTVSFVLAALVAASFASFASFAEGPRADAVFTDVGEADWFFPYVSYAYENGLMTGVSDTLFEPGGDMSRAMIVTVLWRMEGEPSPGGAAPFSDLSADWYRGAVAWAAENGIVNGTGEGRFSPSTPLTREQIAVIMIRYSSYKGFDFPDRADLSAFPDGASVAGYAADAVSRSVAAGLLTGTPRDGLTYLDPRGTATRAQVAAILYRYDLTDKSPASGDRTVLLSADVAPSFVGDAGDLSGGSLALSDFALRLYRGAGTSGKNTLVSPLSVFTALAMTQNGARGETLAEMERTLGLTADDANLFIHTLTDSFGKGDGAQLKTANSVWFTTASRFSVNRAFLKKNADYYGADIFASPFDSGTLDDINGWVEEKTDGMIKKILDVMPPEAVAYMINAICFDAEWASPYHAKDVSEDVFRNSDGTETTV